MTEPVFSIEYRIKESDHPDMESRVKETTDFNWMARRDAAIEFISTLAEWDRVHVIVAFREQAEGCCESCRKAKALGFTPSSASGSGDK